MCSIKTPDRRENWQWRVSDLSWCGIDAVSRSVVDVHATKPWVCVWSTYCNIWDTSRKNIKQSERSHYFASKTKSRLLHSTFKRIQIDVSNVLHSQSKHGVFRSIQASGSDVLPPSSLIDVNKHGSTHFLISLEELGRTNHNILPAGGTINTVQLPIHNPLTQFQELHYFQQILWRLPISIQVHNSDIISKGGCESWSFQNVFRCERGGHFALLPQKHHCTAVIGSRRSWHYDEFAFLCDTVAGI